MTALYERISALEQDLAQARTNERDAIARAKYYARVVQVLALENAQLEERASGVAPVRPIRSGRDPGAG